MILDLAPCPTMLEYLESDPEWVWAVLAPQVSDEEYRKKCARVQWFPVLGSQEEACAACVKIKGSGVEQMTLDEAKAIARSLKLLGVRLLAQEGDKFIPIRSWKI